VTDQWLKKKKPPEMIVKKVVVKEGTRLRFGTLENPPSGPGGKKVGIEKKMVGVTYK
jgi:hypothetical protein